MKTISDIKKELASIATNSSISFISHLLTIFEIPKRQIDKTIGILSEYGQPAYIYRRAVIIRDQSEIEASCLDFNQSYPLVIVLHESSISICSEQNIVKFISFERVCDYAILLQPLLKFYHVEPDSYVAFDFATLIAKLNNALLLISDQEKDSIFDFILDLVTLSYIHSIKPIEQISEFISWNNLEIHDDYFLSLLQIFDSDELAQFCSKHDYSSLKLNRLSKRLILELFRMDLKSIDSERFGSLVYKLFSDDESNLFGNQTSKNNIDKLLNPLFIIKFAERIAIARNNKDLTQIKKDLSSLIFFDPTDSPGCFLSEIFSQVAYLENLINQKLQNQEAANSTIDFNSFIALVSNHVSYRLTRLNLFIVMTQFAFCNIPSIDIKSLYDVFCRIRVHKGNQLLTDWSTICPNNGKVFIVGSPTFKGLHKLTTMQTGQMKRVFHSSSLHEADFCSTWLYKSASYISGTTSKSAFVLTNSVCQGKQVDFLWTKIFSQNCKIEFAYKTFKWKNSDATKGVSVIIIALSSLNGSGVKLLFDNTHCYKCSCISPYLFPNNETIVKATRKPISARPLMRKGNMPYDGGHLLLTSTEKEDAIQLNGDIAPFIKRIQGSEEFINAVPRYCLWISDDNLNAALSIPFLRDRIERVRLYRMTSQATQKTKENPHKFREFLSTAEGTQTLVVPSVSSENREYIPMGFVYSNTVISNLAFVVYNSPTWLLSILESKMHHVWTGLTCGRLESRNRYSNELAYNTFPLPSLSEQQIENLSALSKDLIRIREEFCDVSLGTLYDRLPPKLKNVHEIIDNYVDSCYRQSPFSSDEERIEYLLSLYSKAISNS